MENEKRKVLKKFVRKDWKIEKGQLRMDTTKEEKGKLYA